VPGDIERRTAQYRIAVGKTVVQNFAEYQWPQWMLCHSILLHGFDLRVGSTRPSTKTGVAYVVKSHLAVHSINRIGQAGNIG
jgi:hypothetical protein